MTKIVALKEVFTPGGVPSVTYVGREHLNLEKRVRQAVVRGFAINVVTGPTKSGKSVLCHRVLGQGKLLVVEGGQVQTEAEFWSHVSHQLNIAAQKTKTKTIQSGDKKQFSGTVGWSLGAKFQGQTSIETQDGSTSSTKYLRVDKIDCINAMLENSACLLVDDFHYIERDVQKAIIQGVKGPVMNGLTVFLLAVPHRAFDPVTVENEVEGRFKHIEIPDWDMEDLFESRRLAFPRLMSSVPKIFKEKFARKHSEILFLSKRYVANSVWLTTLKNASRSLCDWMSKV